MVASQKSTTSRAFGSWSQLRKGPSAEHGVDVMLSSLRSLQEVLGTCTRTTLATAWEYRRFDAKERVALPQVPVTASTYK